MFLWRIVVAAAVAEKAGIHAMSLIIAQDTNKW